MIDNDFHNLMCTSKRLKVSSNKYLNVVPMILCNPLIHSCLDMFVNNPKMYPFTPDSQHFGSEQLRNRCVYDYLSSNMQINSDLHHYFEIIVYNRPFDHLFDSQNAPFTSIESNQIKSNQIKAKRIELN